jgi:hypothetical protein
MIESKSIGCSIAAMLLLLSAAPAASAQGVTFPNEVTLLDELANIAWAGECDQIPLIGDRDFPGQRPLSKFATNRDGDIVGWRLNATSPPSGQLDPTSIPMLWIRSTPTSDEWTAVRLPVCDGCTSAAATGVIRVRACENGAPTGIFVSGWQQVGAITQALPDYEPALWYLAASGTGFSAAVPVLIAPFHFDDEVFTDGLGHPEDFLSTGEEGSAWATGAIDVLYRNNCDATGPGPRIVVHATQAYRCVCDGINGVRTVGEFHIAHAPMRIVFDVEGWLEARAAGEGSCRASSPCYEPFRWRLTDQYPAILEKGESSRWLIASREARSTVHVNHAQIAVTRTTVLDHRQLGCAPGMNQCFLEPYTEAVIGPHFGTLVFDDFGSSSTPPEDRYLIGAVARETVFPSERATPRTIIVDPRGMALRAADAPQIDMPLVSMQYESAAKSGAEELEQVSAGWRRWSKDLNSSPWRRRPIAWFPMQAGRTTGPCVDLANCSPIIRTIDRTAFTIRGRADELPFLPATGGQAEDAAWALGCEFVGRSSACSKPQLVGGGSKGARIWYQEGNVWKAQQLPKCDSLTEAHSIMPDGAVVVLGQADCGIRGHPFQPIRVVLPPRAADFNGDGVINGFDLTRLLAAWGTTGECLPEDLNGDGRVDAFDFGMLLASWE